MVQFIFEDGNKDLKGRYFPLGDGIRKYLTNLLNTYEGDKGLPGYKRLCNILEMPNGIEYNELKRIKNFFDNFEGDKKSNEYLLNGGDMMAMWVNNTLNTATKAIEGFKQAKKEAGFKNAYKREHTKDRQNKTTKPTVSKIQTKNLAKNIANNTAIQYVKENKTRNVIITEQQLNRLLTELTHETYQNAASAAFDDEDLRTKKFRTQAAIEYDNNSHYSTMQHRRNEFNDENWLTLNNGKKLVIFDDEYQNLNDLYNGVKKGKLLIHARGMSGEISNDMKYIYPEFSDTLMKFYGGEYETIAQSKSEYYGEEMETEYPELIFASDNFSWCKDSRNGVFFIESDGFQKSLGDGKIQLPNGRICNYWEGDVYDYDSDVFQDEPICCEYGDWYSSQEARVVAVMNIS